MHPSHKKATLTYDLIQGGPYLMKTIHSYLRIKESGFVLISSYLTNIKMRPILIITFLIKGFIAISQFEDNGYKNVIVSIHPDTPEENGSNIIENIEVCACIDYNY